MIRGMEFLFRQLWVISKTWNVASPHNLSKGNDINFMEYIFIARIRILAEARPKVLHQWRCKLTCRCMDKVHTFSGTCVCMYVHKACTQSKQDEMSCRHEHQVRKYETIIYRTDIYIDSLIISHRHAIIHISAHVCAHRTQECIQYYIAK